MEIRLPSEALTLSPLAAAKLLATMSNLFSEAEWWIRILTAITLEHLRYSAMPDQADGPTALSGPEDNTDDLYLHIRDLGEWLKRQGYRVSYEIG